MFLPEISAEEVIPQYLTSSVTITTPPTGAWATPAGDTLILLKCIVGFQPKKVLEIGSYLGTTAKLMAQNCLPDAKIYALDIDPNHGAAYRNAPEANRIVRITGDRDAPELQVYAPFDLIFVDGDHSREGAFLDSLAALKYLSRGGTILWHDYDNDAYFVHATGCVPEALWELKQRCDVDIWHITGSKIAIGFPK